MHPRLPHGTVASSYYEFKTFYQMLLLSKGHYVFLLQVVCQKRTAHTRSSKKIIMEKQVTTGNCCQRLLHCTVVSDTYVFISRFVQFQVLLLSKGTRLVCQKTEAINERLVSKCTEQIKSGKILLMENKVTAVFCSTARGVTLYQRLLTTSYYC